MASATARVYECPICRIAYEKLKVLPCQHTICATCVDRLRYGDTVECIVCYKHYNTSQVRTYFSLAAFLEDLHRPTLDEPTTANPDGAANVEAGATSHDLASVFSKNPFTRQKTVKLKKRPFRLCLCDKQLWCCQYGGVIQIFDCDVEVTCARTLENLRWGSVYDFAKMPNGEILLATTSGLYHVTASGEPITRLDTSDLHTRDVSSCDLHTCVAFYKNKAYAREYRSSELSIYELSGAEWKKTGALPLPLRPYTFVTLSITNDTIVACNVDKPLAVTSLAGEVLATYGEYGRGVPGRIGDPVLGQQDKKGLLIVDKGNDRIQLLDKQGVWSEVTMAPALRKPVGAVVVQDKLYVTLQGENTLCFYKCD